jgi:hypothetical protein
MVLKRLLVDPTVALDALGCVVSDVVQSTESQRYGDEALPIGEVGTESAR